MADYKDFKSKIIPLKIKPKNASCCCWKLVVEYDKLER